jgi:hypothetical protein
MSVLRRFGPSAAEGPRQPVVDGGGHASRGPPDRASSILTDEVTGAAAPPHVLIAVRAQEPVSTAW